LNDVIASLVKRVRSKGGRLSFLVLGVYGIECEALTVNFGVWLPYSDVQLVTDLARLAERAGWHGVFIREHLEGLDSWVPIAATALCTEHIMVGGIISSFAEPNTRQVLKEAYKIHRVSNGRLIICLGDEFLADQLFPGGSRSMISKTSSRERKSPAHKSVHWFASRMVIWRVGLWPNRRSMVSATKHSGVIPVVQEGASHWRSLHAKEIQAVAAFVRQERGTSEGFDIVVEAVDEGLPVERHVESAQACELAGATWWIVRVKISRKASDTLSHLERLLHLGPPTSS
jgi:hypothetical protein